MWPFAQRFHVDWNEMPANNLNPSALLSSGMGWGVAFRECIIYTSLIFFSLKSEELKGFNLFLFFITCWDHSCDIWEWHSLIDSWIVGNYFKKFLDLLIFCQIMRNIKELLVLAAMLLINKETSMSLSFIPYALFLPISLTYNVVNMDLHFRNVL